MEEFINYLSTLEVKDDYKVLVDRNLLLYSHDIEMYDLVNNELNPYKNELEENIDPFIFDIIDETLNILFRNTKEESNSINEILELDTERFTLRKLEKSKSLNNSRVFRSNKDYNPNASLQIIPFEEEALANSDKREFKLDFSEIKERNIETNIKEKEDNENDGNLISGIALNESIEINSQHKNSEDNYTDNIKENDENTHNSKTIERNIDERSPEFCSNPNNPENFDSGEQKSKKVLFISPSNRQHEKKTTAALEKLSKLEDLLKKNKEILDRSKSSDNRTVPLLAQNSSERYVKSSEISPEQSFELSPKLKSPTKQRSSQKKQLEITPEEFFQKLHELPHDPDILEKQMKSLYSTRTYNSENVGASTMSEMNKSESQILDDSSMFDESMNFQDQEDLDDDELSKSRPTLYSQQFTRYISGKNRSGTKAPVEIKKEGVLMKKSKNLIGNFLSRFFVLTDYKLMYFKNKTKGHVKGCINFKMVKAEISRKKKTDIQIEIQGYSKKLILRTKSEVEADEWFAAIKEVIESCLDYKKPSIMIKEAKLYRNMDIITDEDFLSTCKTGDILLFRTNNSTAKLQRSFTGSKFDHVGMVVNIDGDVSVFDTQLDTGVALNSWKTFILENDLFEKVCYRKLYIPESKNDAIQEKFLNFISETIGLKYELSASKIFRRSSVSKKRKAEGENSPLFKKGYFCSELAAAAFKHCGLLDQKISSSSYWPGSFSSEKDMKLLEECYLAPEIAILLERHLK